jgi:hypothetical protein
MDIDTAREMVRTAFRASSELQQLLPALKAACPEPEYRDLALGIAEAIDRIGTNVIDTAIAAHPQLKDEIDASIAQYGRYR